MGQFSAEKPGLPGSVLSGNQQAEHRDPRELLAELRDETAAILGDIEALADELGEPVA
jgi:hypothetical protein